jgi:serine/threonine-protein kinase
MARFRAEGRQAGALSHENIARVYDYGEPAEGEPYLVLELVDGPSLARLLARGAGQPRDAAWTMDLVAQVAAGLQAAHEAGLTHRDIKPANLLLSPDGTVKITDFGIAHSAGAPPVTATGTLVGTPGYLAPERVAGAQATPASDLYALGIVAYECLAGAPPFSGTPLEVALAHRERPLPPLPASVPAAAGALVMQLTAKDASWRPSSAAEVARRAAALRDALAARNPPPPPAAPPDTLTARNPPPPPAGLPGARPRRPTARGLAAVALAALAGLVLAGALRFASAFEPAATPAVTSPGPAATSAAAPGHRQQSRRPPGASPAAAQPAAVPAAMVAPASRDTAGPARKPEPGRRHDQRGREDRHGTPAHRGDSGHDHGGHGKQ